MVTLAPLLHQYISSAVLAEVHAPFQKFRKTPLSSNHKVQSLPRLRKSLGEHMSKKLVFTVGSQNRVPNFITNTPFVMNIESKYQKNQENFSQQQANGGYKTDLQDMKFNVNSEPPNHEPSQKR
jgi:hypothetical protein